jgi:hypothetical protein
MSGVKPWIGFMVVVDVDHEDAVKRVDPMGEIRREDPGAADFLSHILGAPKEVEIKQGITAGVVVATGEGVPDLAPGAKVYYAEQAAIQIGDEKVVHTNYIVAWEEA